VSHYKCHVRDLEFNLFEVLDVDRAFGDGEFSELDVDISGRAESGKNDTSLRQTLDDIV
jgi:hypothetical protein